MLFFVMLALSGFGEPFQRDDERDQVKRMSGPGPDVTVLWGELGIGKTTLWREVVSHRVKSRRDRSHVSADASRGGLPL